MVANVVGVAVRDIRETFESNSIRTIQLFALHVVLLKEEINAMETNCDMLTH